MERTLNLGAATAAGDARTAAQSRYGPIFTAPAFPHFAMECPFMSGIIPKREMRGKPRGVERPALPLGRPLSPIAQSTALPYCLAASAPDFLALIRLMAAFAAAS